MERIHVCYALADANGTYSKFAGASVCSLLENTGSPVAIHLLHDGNLAGTNVEKFRSLVGNYRQELFFHEVPKEIAGTWEKGMGIFAEGLQSPRYTGANMYRLAIPELLREAGRAIYLDADTIVHTDIAALWREEVNGSGLAAVPDLDVLRHYGQEGVVTQRKSFLYEKCGATMETVFNSGVMLMDLGILRQRENLLLEGLRFLAEHAGEYEFYDNDVLIAFFAESYTHLSWQYNIRLEWDQEYGSGRIVPGIYHYLGRNYGLDPEEPRHGLFLSYWMRTPWFGREALHRGWQVAREFTAERARQRMVEVRRIFSVCCRKRRVFVGLAVDEARLRQDFALAEGEPYLPLVPGGALHLPYDPETYVYVFFWSNYGEVKALMERAGWKEYEHFADGTRLMPETASELAPTELTVLWNL